jgi:hypothetical protein
LAGISQEVAEQFYNLAAVTLLMIQLQSFSLLFLVLSVVPMGLLPSQLPMTRPPSMLTAWPVM